MSQIKQPEDFEAVGNIEDANGADIKVSVSKTSDGGIAIETLDDGIYTCVYLFEAQAAELVEDLGKAIAMSLRRKG